MFGDRKDGDRLIPEYEGESPADYPGNNDEYSILGYHYDIREGKKMTQTPEIFRKHLFLGI